jgi:4-carboxymuconolactone decarboxylase
MRLPPLPPETLSPELRYVHDEIAHLVGRSQGPVNMLDTQGALIGPFPAMLHFPQFGIPALEFLRSLDSKASLDKRVREVAIVTVGAAFGARFELYAHEIMAAAFGLSPTAVATLAAAERPGELSNEEAIAHDVARALVTGRIVPASTYRRALQLLGHSGVGELMFLIGGYCLLAMLLNGFDVPAPEAEM